MSVLSFWWKRGGAHIPLNHATSPSIARGGKHSRDCRWTLPLYLMAARLSFWSLAMIQLHFPQFNWIIARLPLVLTVPYMVMCLQPSISRHTPLVLIIGQLVNDSSESGLIPVVQTLCILLARHLTGRKRLRIVLADN
jgi:hypothetical protein